MKQQEVNALIANQRDSNVSDVPKKNIDAFLRTIRYAEGTSGANGYKTMYGGGLFQSYADHPRIVKCYNTSNGKLCSDAAGAYQFLSTTWDGLKSKLKLADFSPINQDAAAIQKIYERGALDYVVSGQFALAIDKCKEEWASLPGSPYGQPTKSLAELSSVYSSNGGSSA